jgi:hypothetical protein
MRPSVPAVLAVALAAASLSALAQQSNPGAQAQPAQAGFFPPKPGDDLSLMRTLPPEAYQPPAPVSPAPAAAPAAPAVPATPAAPLVVVMPPNGETQADRAEAEARRAREAAARLPTPINGAFTGLTDERDR